ncbi:tail sheath stabilizer and completion protein [bacterium]|nr:tail sheath stabilizer and completion protein [bacterium]
MYGNHFYNESTRRYVAVFGTMFNDIEITRKDNAGTAIQKMVVPINYAPMQKMLAKLEQDPNLDAPAMTLPRMSFEISGMTYSAERKLGSLNKTVSGTTSSGTLQTMFSPAPYDIEFQLNIMTKYNEDGMKILEQILPYFKPDCTVSVKTIDAINKYVDIPIVLNSVSQEDNYESDFQTRRALVWTLNFTMKAFFYGPVTEKKRIKFVDVDLYPSLVDSEGGEQITVQVETIPVTATASSTVLESGKQYKIYDFGTSTQADWNTYLTGSSLTGNVYKLGDIFTANGNSIPSFSQVTPVPTNGEEWEYIVQIVDGDGTEDGS